MPSLPAVLEVAALQGKKPKTTKKQKQSSAMHGAKVDEHPTSPGALVNHDTMIAEG